MISLSPFSISPSLLSFLSSSFQFRPKFPTECRSTFHSRLEKSSSPSSSPSSSMANAEVAASLPPLPEKRIVVGVGTISVDYLAAVAAYPKPDDKIRSTSLKVQGGGNVGNALTGAARLGLTPRIISKVANDAQGRSILEELEADGVDISFIVVSEEGNSPFTYVIVDSQMKTRTCIHTPGHPGMIPSDLSQSSLLSALDGARLVYFDVRLHKTAIVVAKECRQTACRYLFWLMQKERGRV